MVQFYPLFFLSSLFFSIYETFNTQRRARRKTLPYTYITHRRRNLKKHWKHRGLFLDPEAEKSSLQRTQSQAATRRGKLIPVRLWEKFVLAQNSFFFQNKKASFVEKVFSRGRKRRAHVCVCVCMSWGWMLKKRMKFSKFHLFRVFFHIKSSALFFFAFTKMPRRSSMKQNYKYLRLCSCFAAFASPLIPSPAKIKMCV